ncbi:EcsC family protein [Atopococcus tabaci]|uniref:EcsC family protein n=1 Tax=Atopococcus tabaci TaxID=269774 RepID=UPI00240A6E91|nr:EcsC family protein [Atopococcus tabaci]
MDFAYEKCLNGIPKVSKPVEELANDYIERYGYTDKAIEKLIKNQLSKNTSNGFVSGLGGFATMPVTLPANITSVAYVQMRMIAAIAVMRGYNLHNDEVQTFVYACIVGKAAGDVLKSSGIKFSTKIGQNLINKIPGKVLININKKIGFRFITKGGTTGIINLGKAIPLLGAGVGSAFDFTTTKVIANRAKKLFGEDGNLNFEALEK